MRDFHDLKVWDKAHKMVLAIYAASSSFPQREMYGLTSQLRRAAVSVASNIAEGCGRNSEADFRHFLHIAMGSASEVQYHLLLAHDINFLDEPEFKKLESDLTEVKRMLASLIGKLQ